MKKKLKKILFLYFIAIIPISFLYFFYPKLAVVIVSLLTLLLFLALLLILLNTMVKKTTWYKNKYRDVDKFWTKFNFNLDVVNLGSNSAKYAFNYEDANKVNGENWAIGSQSLEHDFKILLNYNSYISKGGYVLITICPFSFLKTSYNKKSWEKYYTILHPSLIDSYNYKEKVRVLNLKRFPIIYSPWKSLLAFVHEFYSLTLKKELKIDFNDNAKYWKGMWKKQFGIDDLDFKPKAEFLDDMEYKKEVLNSIIKFCHQRDLNPIIILPPVSEELSQEFSEIFKENYIYNIIEEFKVPFLNYWDDVNFKEDKYYRNAYLLNENGAKKFTNKVLKDIGLIN